jgi:hypothetical protein
MSNNALVSSAQIALSVIYIVAYFWLLNKFLNGEIKTPAEWRDQMGILIGVLAGGIPVILQFWFARSREKTPQE